MCQWRPSASVHSSAKMIYEKKKKKLNKTKVFFYFFIIKTTVIAIPDEKSHKFQVFRQRSTIFTVFFPLQWLYLITG